MPVQKYGHEILKGTINKQTGMCEVLLKTQLSESTKNNILAQTTKSELSQYLNAALFIPTTTRLLKASKPGFLKTWTGPLEKLINNQIEK